MQNEIIAIIDQIRVNKRNGQYAVYKPLLLLIIFKDVLDGKPNEFRFNDVYKRLQGLMEKYGWETVSRKRAEYPFHFLASSILWETNIDKDKLKHPDSPTKVEMENAIGKLNNKVYSFLQQNPNATVAILKHVQDKYFKRDITF